MHRSHSRASFPTIMLMVSFVITSMGFAAAPSNPRELGRVSWGRDLDAALKSSSETGKPVLLLFQEIPGCQGCKDFGDQPLSHPLLVEAIEDLFNPVAIYNNKPGKDEEVLKRFDEPAWNYPVMRLLNAEGRDLIPRRDQIFSVHGVATRLIAALKAANREAPAYLQLVADESDPDASHRETAVFAMHCFWEGEAKLGAIDGVTGTRAAFLDGQEVVEVTFNVKVVSYRELVNAADRAECAVNVFAQNSEQLAAAKSVAGDHARKTGDAAKPAPPSDQKHTLAQSELRYLPLTPMQATKVNSALHLNQDFRPWLSPRKIQLLTKIHAARSSDSDSLKGLSRPDSIEQLPAYEDQLRARMK